MSSARSGLAATGVQSGQLIGHRSGLTYNVRMVAVPADRVSCRSPPGSTAPGSAAAPRRPCGADGEHAARRPGQLMIVVGVPVEDQARGHGKGHDDDGSRGVRLTRRALSVLRHRMSAYALGLDQARP